MCKEGQSLLIDRGKGNVGQVLREQHLADIFRFFAGPVAGLAMSRRLELEPGLNSFYDPITISNHTKK